MGEPRKVCNTLPPLLIPVDKHLAKKISPRVSLKGEKPLLRSAFQPIALYGCGGVRTLHVHVDVLTAYRAASVLQSLS